MNKEERLKDYLEGYKSQYLYRQEDGLFHTLDNDIKGILNENKQLKERIDKAIEILNAMEHIENLFKMGGVKKTNIDKLLEILKGDSNE